MARDEFDNAGEYVQMRDLEGELILFTPREHIKGITTAFNDDKDAVRADLAVLRADGSVAEYEDVLIFQGGLISTLKRRIKVEKSIDRDPVTGVVTWYETTTVKRVLGVLGKGEAKKNQSAPYELTSATDAQKDLARAYTADNPTPEPEKKIVSQELQIGVTSAPAAAPARDEFSSQPASGTGPFNPGGPATDDPWATEQ